MRISCCVAFGFSTLSAVATGGCSAGQPDIMQDAFAAGAPATASLTANGGEAPLADARSRQIDRVLAALAIARFSEQKRGR